MFKNLKLWLFLNFNIKILKLISSIFCEKGTYYGKCCCGYQFFPNAVKCGGCSDCKNGKIKRPFLKIKKDDFELFVDNQP